MDFGEIFDLTKQLAPLAMDTLATHAPGLLDKGKAWFLNHAQDEIIPGLSAELFIEQLASRLQSVFPGLTVEAVKRNEIPIATCLVEEYLVTWAREQHLLEGRLECLALTSVQDAFVLKVGSSLIGVRHNTFFQIAAERIEFKSSCQQARFRCEGEPEVHGANWLGVICEGLAKAIICKSWTKPLARQG